MDPFKDKRNFYNQPPFCRYCCTFKKFVTSLKADITHELLDLTPRHEKLYLNRMEQPALQKIVRQTHKPSSKAIVLDKVCTVLHINSHLISGRLDVRLLKKMSRWLEKRHSEDQRPTSGEIVRRSPP